MHELYKSKIDKVGVGAAEWPSRNQGRKLYLALDELYYYEREELLPLCKKLQSAVHASAESK